MKRTDLNRRDFTKLTMAAFGGMVAGATAGASSSLGFQSGNHNHEEHGTKKEVHVCRGLNSCKNQGAKKNGCAGMGNCATATAHACAGHNDCKNQGGCGAAPGENKCKSQGKCGVPLSDKAWKSARARFEERMTKAKKDFGAAPKKVA